MDDNQRHYGQIALQYATDVVNGDIVACKWIKLQCEAFLNDLDDCENDDFPYFLDVKAAFEAAEFIETLPLTKVKGRFAKGQRPKLILSDWQCFVIVNVFGWKKKVDGYRRYREVLLFLPRKNGKSEFAAAIALYMFVLDEEDAAEIYSGGRNEKQAEFIFKAAKRMIQYQPALRKHFDIEVFEHSLSIHSTQSKFEKLIGDPEDGGDPHVYCCDEYHEHKTNSQFDTMKTGMISRLQPLIIVTTTAGTNIEGPCFSYVIEAQKVLQGALDRSDLFSMIFTVDEGVDPQSETALEMSNPGFGTLIPKEQLRADRQSALATPAKWSKFKIKHLNMWQGSDESYFDVEAWLRKCSPPDDELERILDWLRGRPCYIGCDLSGKLDLTAWVAIFPFENGGFFVLPRFYMPENTLATRYDHDSKLAQWADEDRFIQKTDGDMIDIFHVTDEVKAFCRDHDVQSIGYDPTHSVAFVQIMQKSHAALLREIPNKAIYMSDPMKFCSGLISEGKVKHDNNPVMTWMMSNVVRKSNRDDLDYPAKLTPENKIDGPVSMIQAYAQMMVAPEPFEPFVVGV